MASPFEKLVDSSHRYSPVQAILDLPPDALLGVSAADSGSLKTAFGIETIRDLASSPEFAAAVALMRAAQEPGFDGGPTPEWAAIFETAPLPAYQVSDRFRLEFGPVYYRGRLNGTARLLIVGQDPAPNELIAHRIFVGASGQRIQGLLHKLGTDRSYLMFNTFLYSVFGQYDSELAEISGRPPIAGFRERILDKALEDNPIEVIIAVGRAAREAVDWWDPPGAIHRENITHPGSPDSAAVSADWNLALETLGAAFEPDPEMVADLTPYGDGFAESDHEPIPKGDLPFGIPEFLGRGDHVTRDGNDVLVFEAP
ncbi:MAG: uracil-DNA glycosylase [Acidimicrobiia bacterium]|nr:uracil-DNA glycosylase [Acidimicrobiia bacterium]